MRLGRRAGHERPLPVGGQRQRPSLPQRHGVRAVRLAQIGRVDLSVRIAALLVEEEMPPVVGEVGRDGPAEPGEVALVRLVRDARRNEAPVVLGEHSGVEKETVARDVVQSRNPRRAPRAPREVDAPSVALSPAREEDLGSRRAPEDRPEPRPFVGQDLLLAGPIHHREGSPLAVAPGMVEERDEIAVGRHAHGADEPPALVLVEHLSDRILDPVHDGHGELLAVGRPIGRRRRHRESRAAPRPRAAPGRASPCRDSPDGCSPSRTPSPLSTTRPGSPRLRSPVGATRSSPRES